MISFSQFFHGYHGIKRNFVRRRFHIQICQLVYILLILQIDKKSFINTMPFCKYIPNVPMLVHTINIIISFDLYCLISHSKSDKH